MARSLSRNQKQRIETQVEAGKIRPTCQPGFRCTQNPPPLTRRHGLQRSGKGGAPLDLDEGEARTAPGNQIDLTDR